MGVARALAADPPILLMDEPYSAVDPIVRARLQDDLLALQATVDKTIVIVTHDIDEAIELADRVAIMAEGGLLDQYDTPDELLEPQPTSSWRRSSAGRGPAQPGAAQGGRGHPDRRAVGVAWAGTVLAISPSSLASVAPLASGRPASAKRGAEHFVRVVRQIDN